MVLLDIWLWCAFENTLIEWTSELWFKSMTAQKRLSRGLTLWKEEAGRSSQRKSIKSITKCWTRCIDEMLYQDSLTAQESVFAVLTIAFFRYTLCPSLDYWSDGLRMIVKCGYSCFLWHSSDSLSNRSRKQSDQLYPESGSTCTKL